MKILKTVFITVSFLFFASLAAFSQVNAQLDSLISDAIENNPRIQAAYNSWQAARHKVKVVRGLPDPAVHYTYFGENIETRVGPHEKKYGASQKIPFPGKLHLKAKAQSKQAQMLKEKYEAAKREIIKDIKFVYYDIFWVDRAISVTEEEKAILESLERVAQRKYESNRAPQQDVIKAQVELSKLIDRLYMLKQNRQSLVAKLNIILNRGVKTPLEEIASVEGQEFSYELDSLHEIVKSTSQELSEADLNIERAQYEKSLAQMGFLPDFTFGFDKIEIEGGTSSHPEDGKDAWMGTVALTIPFWLDRVTAEISEKKEKLKAAQQKRQSAANDVSYEVEDLYFKIITYKDIILLYTTALLPQTQQAYDAAKTSYETGAVDFLNWLDAERVLLQTRLAYYKAITDYQKSFAYLERVIGKDL